MVRCSGSFHDVDGMWALMAGNHLFIDGLGNSVTGLEAMRKAWQAYFAMVPDYWIRVERQIYQDSVVAMFGKAGGTLASDGRLDRANQWEIPAAWQAIVSGGGVGRFSQITNLSGRS
ncbi:MAG TPA: nuclear transport factor 2 family protein [Pyrinomonadaceae bacterium]|nr:nuclear transport factor 2 family protein [Pyrinomonadaceae bacterium]